MEIQRLKEERLLKSLAHFPCVGILGPRQCGKTTLSKLLMTKAGKQSVYLDMESERDRAAISSPELFLDQHMDDCVVLDEIQIKPDLFPILRSSIDKNRVPGRFILLGSSSPQLLRKSNESLAGRVSYHELSPFNLLEIDKPLQHRLTGGYPECYLLDDVEVSFEWLSNYVASYTERELPALGLNTNPQKIRKLLTMLAHVHGQLLNIEQLSGSLGASATSVRNYLDFIENAFLIRRLAPFHANLKKRLVKSPKAYIRGVGVLHQLLGINSRQDYEFSPSLGASWEGYVIEQVLQLLPSPYQAYFYRTHQGTECDLVIVKGAKPLLSIEVKYTAAPKMTKSFTTAINDLETKRNFIIVPREEDFPLREDVQVMGLETFLRVVITNL